ncbi:MAG: hypothetical protein ABJD23_13365, partial [Nonlabens sp.]
IIEVLKDLFALTDENELAYGGKDLLPLLKDNGVLTTTRKVNDVLRSKLNPEEKNGSYSKHQVNYNINGERYLNSNNEKGRHFIFKRDIVESF